MSTSIKLTIKLQAVLADPLSDYLLGVHEAAVETGVSENGEPLVLQAFIESTNAKDETIGRLTAQVEVYSRELAEHFSCQAPVVSGEIIEEQDWSENWKAYFKPFAIVPGLVIAPSWEEYRPALREKVIVMDPGMAFGTGQHETTRLCLELLKEIDAVADGAAVLDVGTGTGILGMASLLFGAARVLGVDNDPEAVRAAGENVRINNLSAAIEMSGVDIKDLDSGFDIVMANIVHDVLIDLSDDLARLTRGGGRLILSGLLDGEQSQNLVRCFERKSFELKIKKIDGQWAALCFEKSSADTAV